MRVLPEATVKRKEKHPWPICTDVRIRRGYFSYILFQPGGRGARPCRDEPGFSVGADALGGPRSPCSRRVTARVSPTEKGWGLCDEGKHWRSGQCLPLDKGRCPEGAEGSKMSCAGRSPTAFGGAPFSKGGQRDAREACDAILACQRDAREACDAVLAWHKKREAQGPPALC